MNVISNSQLVDVVASATGQPKVVVAKVIAEAARQIVSSAKNGDSVRIKDLGTFQGHTREARAGRNPATGEEIQIPRRSQVKFKATSLAAW